MSGWIKLHKKLLKNPIFLNANLLQLFIYCVLKANYEVKEIIFNKKLLKINRGQFVTGRKVLADDLKQNPRTTYERLKLLEELQYINIKTNNRFSLITVVNYDLYQLIKEETNNKTNNKPTTSQQQTNTTKKYKNLKKLKKKDILTSTQDVDSQQPQGVEGDNLTVEPHSKVLYKKVVDLYNIICKTLPKVQQVTDKRKGKIKLRWFELEKKCNDGPLKGFEDIFIKVEASNFLKGQNKNNWVCNFDWIVSNDNNYVKILEGNYDNRSAPAFDRGYNTTLSDKDKEIVNQGITRL